MGPMFPGDAKIPGDFDIPRDFSISWDLGHALCHNVNCSADLWGVVWGGGEDHTWS